MNLNLTVLHMPKDTGWFLWADLEPDPNKHRWGVGSRLQLSPRQHEQGCVGAEGAAKSDESWDRSNIRRFVGLFM